MSEEIKIPASVARKPIKFIFDKDPTVQTHSPDGCWVESGHFGKIILNFYLERLGIPGEVVYEINPDGSLKTGLPEIPAELNADSKFFVMHRQIQTCVVLDVSGAQQLMGLLENFLKGVSEFQH